MVLIALLQAHGVGDYRLKLCLLAAEAGWASTAWLIVISLYLYQIKSNLSPSSSDRYVASFWELPNCPGLKHHMHKLGAYLGLGVRTVVAVFTRLSFPKLMAEITCKTSLRDESSAHRTKQQRELTLKGTGVAR